MNVENYPQQKFSVLSIIPILVLALLCNIAWAQTGKSVVVGSLVERPNAIMILNPPENNQGMLVPQLTTAERLAVRPLSPQEDGLLLFDKSEKLFYYWKEDNWVGLAPGVSIPRYMMIDPSEFTNLRRSDKKDKDNIIMFEDNSTYVTTIKKSEGPQIIAPLQLPDGATIEQVTLYYMDREANDIVFDVFRKTPTGSNEPVISSWSSSGSSNTIRASVHMPTPGKHIVDNSNYSYRVVIKLDQANDLTDSNDANLRVYAVRVRYVL